MFKNRYKYTCPDVIHYRKNQYRLVVWSNVASIAWMVAFFGGLAALNKKYESKTPDIETPIENQE